MKELTKPVIVLLLAISFCCGFVLVYKLSTSFIEKVSTQSVENNVDSDYEVLVFTSDRVDIVKLGDLENFKRQNPVYSFIVPKGKENYFEEKLTSENRNEGLIFSLEINQIADDRQLITLSSDDVRSIVKNVYEATDNQVFPKTSMYVNLRYSIPKIIGSAVGGILACLLLLFIYKKISAKDQRVFSR